MAGVIGFFIKLLVVKGKRRHQAKLQKLRADTEVFLMIHCDEDQADNIEQLLWNHNALGVGTLD